MTSSLDLLDADQLRLQAAERVRLAKDVRLPELKLWNTDPCPYHEVATPTCEYRQCGGELWAHQRVGVSWLYVRKRGILADGTGTGKTNQIYGLLALLKQRGELTGRALVVCQTPAALQWLKEGHRWVPSMNVEAVLSGMTRRQRIDRYSRNWDVMITGYHLMMRDVDMLEKIAPDVLIVDDVDPMLNHDNQTHRDLELLKRNTSRSVVINATTLQIRLQQLHAAATLADGHDVFGPLPNFERRYIRQEPITIYNNKTGRRTVKLKTVGHKNLDELKDKLAPMILRRKDSQLDDVNMPIVLPPTDVWLELHPAQREKYKQLQTDILTLENDEHTKSKQLVALSKITYGQQICAGLPALSITEKETYTGKDGTDREKVHVLGHEKDGPGASVKLDWLMTQLTSEWQTEKLVVFIKNIGLLEAFQERLRVAKIASASVRGGQTSEVRNAEIDSFWNDPARRVLIGTSAIERSLNLQVANRLVFVDLHLNPARVTQIVGRVKRGGSKHKHIFVYNLLTRDTQEEGYMNVLEQRQALADYVFDDTSELFEQLSPGALLDLIGPNRWKS